MEEGLPEPHKGYLEETHAMSKEIVRPPSGQKTPAGGVVAEIYYFDEQDRPAPKAQATRVIIRELDAAGRLLRETFGTKEVGAN